MELSLQDILDAICYTNGASNSTSFYLLLLQSVINNSRGKFVLNTRYSSEGALWSYYAVNYMLTTTGYLSFCCVFKNKKLVGVNRYCPFSRKYYSFITFGDYVPMKVIIDNPIVVEHEEPKSWPKLAPAPAPAPPPLPASPVSEPKPAPITDAPKYDIDAKALINDIINSKPEPPPVPENTVCTVVYDRDENIDNLSTSTPSTNRIKVSLNQILKPSKKSSKPSFKDYGDGFFVKTSGDSKTLIIMNGRSSKIVAPITNKNIDMAPINHIQFQDLPRLNKTTIKFDYDDEDGMWSCPCGARGFNLNSINLHWQSNKHYHYDQQFA